ncbi:MAG: hypothetical protein ABIA21_04225, partial [Candidatus Aenigmatarchaeota archaeon]
MRKAYEDENFDVIDFSPERAAGGLLYFKGRERKLDVSMVYGSDAGFVFNEFGYPVIRESVENLRRNLPSNKVVIVTGFEGKLVSNGSLKAGARNINDALVSLLVAALGGRGAGYEIMKDEDYVLSINPNPYGVRGKPVEKLSLDEAVGLTGSGAEFIHQLTLPITEMFGLEGHIGKTVLSRKSLSTRKNYVVAMHVERYPMVSALSYLMDTPEYSGVFADTLGVINSHNFVVLDSSTQSKGFSVSYRPENKKDVNGVDIRVAIACQHRKTGRSLKIRQKPAWGITLVGRAMKRRPNTLGELCSLAGQNGISIRMLAHADEEFFFPQITLYFDEKYMPKVLELYADTLGLRVNNI